MKEVLEALEESNRIMVEQIEHMRKEREEFKKFLKKLEEKADKVPRGNNNKGVK